MGNNTLLVLTALLLAHGSAHTRLNAALLKAVQRDDLAGVRRLLALGANARAKTTDERRRPALNLAVEDGDVPMVQVLLTHGADSRAVDSEGNTALTEAADGIGDGQYDRSTGLPIVQSLLAHGANPLTRNSYGYTAGMLADDRGVEWLVQLLRDAEQRPRARAGRK